MTSDKPKAVASDALFGVWMPIETAPSHTPILATDGKVIVVLEKGECADELWPDAVGFGGYEWDWEFNWEDLTHWMPLPPLPNASIDARPAEQPTKEAR